MRSFLEREVGPALVAAFVYGSVAAGVAGPESDLDCFVLTGRTLAPRTRTVIGERFAELQARLGFVPDRRFPVELFSTRRCWSALRGTAVASALRAASEGEQLEAGLAETDDLEVLRALVSQRLLIVANPTLDRLSAAAFALVQPLMAGRGHAGSRILACLGVRHPDEALWTAKGR